MLGTWRRKVELSYRKAQIRVTIGMAVICSHPRVSVGFPSHQSFETCYARALKQPELEMRFDTSLRTDDDCSIHTSRLAKLTQVALSD